MCAVAELLGVRALLVPGAALVLVCALAAAHVRLACRRVRLVREPVSETAQEGSQVTLATRLVGPRVLRRSGEFAATAAAEPSPRRWLDGDSVRFAATAQRRGLHHIDPSLLRFSDPFGLCERTVASSATELLVLPRIESIAGPELAKLHAASDTRARASSSGELDGIQPAQLHAPAGRIHWASFARTGTLIERRTRPEEDSRPLIVLDGRNPSSGEDFDKAVRAAASLAVALARAGGCSLLLAPERRAHRLDAALSSWKRIHARLALLEPSAALAWDVLARARLLLWVTASIDARAPARTRDGSIRFLISPHKRDPHEVLFTVAGCTVERLPARARARVA